MVWHAMVCMHSMHVMQPYRGTLTAPHSTYPAHEASSLVYAITCFQVEFDATLLGKRQHRSKSSEIGTHILLPHILLLPPGILSATPASFGAPAAAATAAAAMHAPPANALPHGPSKSYPYLSLQLLGPDLFELAEAGAFGEGAAGKQRLAEVGLSVLKVGNSGR